MPVGGAAAASVVDKLNSMERNRQNCMSSDTGVQLQNSTAEMTLSDHPNSNTSQARREWQMGDARFPDSQNLMARLRDGCGRLVNSGPFQALTTCLILANAILLGVLTFDSITDNEETTSMLEKVDLAILSVFTLEFILQFIYLGFSLVRNSWLIFDCIIISFSWLFLGSSVAILRSFRIFRIFSLVSRWESLRLLFEAVGKTMPKMASIWLTLMIFFYIFCVLLTTLYADLYDEGYLDWDYFGRLDYTFITLFQIMTLDSWTDVVRQVMDARPWAWIGFFAWVIITSFFVLNLVVAVICESLIEMQKVKDQEKQGKFNRENQSQETPTAFQMEELIRQQGHMLRVQQDLIRTQVEMQQTLNALIGEVRGTKNHAMVITNEATSKPTNQLNSKAAVILDPITPGEEESMYNSTDSILQQFHASADESIFSNHGAM